MKQIYDAEQNYRQEMRIPLEPKTTFASIETPWEWMPPALSGKRHSSFERDFSAETEIAGETNRAAPSDFTPSHSDSRFSDRRSVSARWLPFAPWNLRRNPFGELTPQERAEVAVCDTSDWEKFLRRPRHAVELVGPKGRGKSTRLLKFHFENQGSSYQYLPPRKILPRWRTSANPTAIPPQESPAIMDGTVVIIDEAQRMSGRMWRAVIGSGRPLLLSTHFSISSLLRIRGYRVHSIRIGQHNDAPLIAAAMSARIEASRLAPGPVPRITIERAAQWRTQFGSNVRAIESALYERVQQEAVGKTYFGNRSDV